MSSTLSTITTNSHIAAFDSALTEATQSIECFVIAPNNPKMLAALMPALDGEAAAILEVTQDLWDFNGSQLSEAIQWVLEQTDLKQLVLVGHTLADGPQSRALLTNPQLSERGEDSYQKLLSSVHFNNTRNRSAENRLSLQIQQVLEIPLVASRCSTGELSVHGLLYRSESGLFLAYDTNQNAFYPPVA